MRVIVQMSQRLNNMANVPMVTVAVGVLRAIRRMAMLAVPMLIALYRPIVSLASVLVAVALLVVALVAIVIVAIVIVAIIVVTVTIVTSVVLPRLMMTSGMHADAQCRPVVMSLSRGGRETKTRQSQGQS